MELKPLSYSMNRIGNIKKKITMAIFPILPTSSISTPKICSPKKKGNKTSANFHFSGFYVLVYLLPLCGVGCFTFTFNSSLRRLYCMYLEEGDSLRPRQ